MITLKKNIITLSSLLFILTNITLAQQKNIRIRVAADILPENSAVYIVGNTDQLGNWNFMQKMDKKSDKEWQFDVKADAGDTVQFKFTRGEWANEAVDFNGIEYPNFVHAVKKDTLLVYRIPDWRDKVHRQIFITPERLTRKAGFLELIEGWRYKIGDDSSWANPLFNDTEWKTINPQLTKNDLEKLDWTGNIWFRNHIRVDSSLWKKTFGFLLINTGAAEVYLNGKLLYKFGVVGHSKESETIFIDRTPKHIQFDEMEKQVIAVRYSNHRAKELLLYNIPAGFGARIGDLNFYITDRINNVRSNSIYQMAVTAFVLAFAIMHFLLFVFYPRAKENLFYAVCMLAFSGVVYTGMQPGFTNSMLDSINIWMWSSLSIQASMLFGLLTVYYSSYNKIPKQYWFFTIASGLFLIHTIFFPSVQSSYFDYAFYTYIIIVAVEIVRIVIQSAAGEGTKGWGWLIGVGFLLAMVFIVYQILIIANIITQPLFGIRLVYIYGIICLAITVSINLSKKVSDTNKDLEKQLAQVKELSSKAVEQERKAKEEELAKKLLEADNARKTRELEEASKLQLSMLPDKIPSVPNLDIAVYMKPATEVGGDYYDFKYNKNGTLTIAIGDATGHGMKAGTMVATIKGLFTAESVDTDIVSFMNKSNAVIRDMHLGNLYMAMLLVKLQNDKLSITSAGMPPALIFRSATKTIEEIRMRALPLGGSSELKYSKREEEFSSGDTLLLMSDGFPELFNKEKELLGYEKAKELFSSYAELNSNQIIERLCKDADNWRGDANQEDDITFVVVKFK